MTALSFALRTDQIPLRQNLYFLGIRQKQHKLNCKKLCQKKKKKKEMYLYLDTIYRLSSTKKMCKKKKAQYIIHSLPQPLIFKSWSEPLNTFVNIIVLKNSKRLI